MLEIIGELITALVLIGLVSLVLEMLIPSENYRQYIRMVAGLIILLMVINSFSELFRREQVDIYAQHHMPVSAKVDRDTLENEGRRLWELSQQQVLQEYENEIIAYLEPETVTWEDWKMVDLELVMKEEAFLPMEKLKISADDKKDNLDLLKELKIYVAPKTSPPESASNSEDAESSINNDINIERPEISPVQIGEPKTAVVDEESGSEVREGSAEDVISEAEIASIQGKVAHLLQIPGERVKVVLV